MPGDITRLLRRVKHGDKKAEDDLVTAVYDELRRLARFHLRSGRPDQTLQPTVLVHEAYLKLAGGARIEWHDRQHFFRLASRVMRQVVVDYARSRMTQKRGGQRELLLLNEALAGSIEKPVEILALNDALDLLRKRDQRVYQVVELRFFGGLSIQETAETMEISERTVKREWNVGRAWLKGELDGGGDADGSTAMAPG